MEFQDVQGALALLCSEEEASRRDEVADIEQLERLVRFSQVVDAEKDLDASCAVFDLREGGLAHVAHQAQASGQDEISIFALPFIKMREYFRDGMRALYSIGIGVDALFPHGAQPL